jgi:glycosyltransferase involved in cell wall biosynthesis
MTIAARRHLRIFVAHASDHLTDHQPHGDGLVAEGFIRHLAERNHQIDVAVESVALRRRMPANVRLHHVPVPPLWKKVPRLGFILGVRRLFRDLQKQGRFDIVHQLNPVFTGVSLAMHGLHHHIVLGPFVPHWPAGADVSEMNWGAARMRDWISRVQQQHAGALLVTTPAALSRVKSRSTANGPLIFEVPHGIDLAAFQPRASPPPRPSILFLANMWRRKGIFTLLQAFTRVRREVPTATLTVAGRGSDEQLMEQAVAAHPCRAAIAIVGNIGRAEVPALLRSHSVYCLPSFGEPFGMTILEAMASGVPVVTSNCGGPGFLVDDRGGRLVPPDDDDRLAAALIEVLSSPSLQHSMGQHNRVVAEQRFAWTRVIDALEDAYYSTLERGRPSSDDLHARSTPRPLPVADTTSC